MKIFQVIQEGSDITLVGWGAQISVLKDACTDAAKVLILLSVFMHSLVH